MMPKPPFPRPNPKRLTKRYAVTIVAGFKCKEGIVVCADTQETVGISKRNVPKLRIEPSLPTGGRGQFNPEAHKDMAVAFCGATDNGPFVDKLVDNAWNASKDTTTIQDACLEIEKSVKETYREFGEIYQPGYCPSAEVIYGVKFAGESKLFSASGPVVNEQHGFSSGGIGSYMADFLSSRLYSGTLGIRQCIILAAYVLFQAKEHVDGCGGHSEIAVLRNAGTCGMLEWQHTNSLTKLVRFADRETGTILMDFANLGLDDEEFKRKSIKRLELVTGIRSQEREQIEDLRAAWAALAGGKYFTDEIGLPSE
jgi:hypothetical protein